MNAQGQGNTKAEVSGKELRMRSMRWQYLPRVLYTKFIVDNLKEAGTSVQPP